MIAYLLSVAVYCILELLRDAFQSKVSMLKIILEVEKSTELRVPQAVRKSFSAGSESRVRLHLSHRRHISHLDSPLLLHNRLVLLEKRQAESR